MSPDGFTNREEHVEMPMQDAMAELSFLDAQLQALGAVDSEHGQIAGLRAQILSCVLSPEEAITRARAIL